MKKLTSLLMVLSLAVFTIGCGGGEEPGAGNGGTDSTPAGGTEEGTEEGAEMEGDGGAEEEWADDGAGEEADDAGSPFDAPGDADDAEEATELDTPADPELPTDE